MLPNLTHCPPHPTTLPATALASPTRCGACGWGTTPRCRPLSPQLAGGAGAGGPGCQVHLRAAQYDTGLAAARALAWARGRSHRTSCAARARAGTCTRSWVPAGTQGQQHKPCSRLRPRRRGCAHVGGCRAQAAPATATSTPVRSVPGRAELFQRAVKRLPHPQAGLGNTRSAGAVPQRFIYTRAVGTLPVACMLGVGAEC